MSAVRLVKIEVADLKEQVRRTTEMIKEKLPVKQFNATIPHSIHPNSYNGRFSEGGNMLGQRPCIVEWTPPPPPRKSTVGWEICHVYVLCTLIPHSIFTYIHSPIYPQW